MIVENVFAEFSYREFPLSPGNRKDTSKIEFLIKIYLLRNINKVYTSKYIKSYKLENLIYDIFDNKFSSEGLLFDKDALKNRSIHLKAFLVDQTSFFLSSYEDEGSFNRGASIFGLYSFRDLEGKKMNSNDLSVLPSIVDQSRLATESIDSKDVYFPAGKLFFQDFLYFRNMNSYLFGKLLSSYYGKNESDKILSFLHEAICVYSNSLGYVKYSFSFASLKDIIGKYEISPQAQKDLLLIFYYDISVFLKYLAYLDSVKRNESHYFSLARLEDVNSLIRNFPFFNFYSSEKKDSPNYDLIFNKANSFNGKIIKQDREVYLSDLLLRMIS
jgi:hypothetical protein